MLSEILFNILNNFLVLQNEIEKKSINFFFKSICMYQKNLTVIYASHKMSQYKSTVIEEEISLEALLIVVLNVFLVRTSLVSYISSPDKNKKKKKGK